MLTTSSPTFFYAFRAETCTITYRYSETITTQPILAKMAATETIRVTHLGGVDAGYRVSASGISPAKPTVVLINSMCTTSSLYNAQFDDKSLNDAINLLAIEPLGHGATATVSKLEQFTYWDSAAMALQVMDALNIRKAFALGTSQGGWVIVRMALLAPERVRFPPLHQCWLGAVINGGADPRVAAPRHINGLRVPGISGKGLLGS